MDINGSLIFVTRFIKAQQPPEELNTIDKILRFVSLIPFLGDRAAFAASCDLWSTSDVGARYLQRSDLSLAIP